MSDLINEITPVSIEDELKQSYLDYAMSVIVGRALPDVRDGLKPVHRRVLFAMRELSNDWNKPYKKSARIVGDVIGKYHPHGDDPVYQTIVRMAQSFSMRYVLVDGQGNFGSIDGDSPAAMRYTEVRMAKLAHSLLADLDKETVDTVPNYDETEMIPDVLPTRVPNLLVNGTTGIAVGMATNIPPHQLGEIIDGCLMLIETPESTVDDLMAVIPGPDFPTAGIIHGRAGIHKAYHTGRGSVHIRARVEIETEKSGKETIVVTELPYQVNKARLLEKIAELVKNKHIDGITALRDESDKDGMRMVVELRRGEYSDVILNQLYKHTQMQTVFGINMVALVHKQPELLNLKSIIQAFIHHRQEVVTRRTVYELRKARERAHILEGLGIALVNIDEVIALIKASKNPAEAKEGLLDRTWQSGDVAGLIGRIEDRSATIPQNLGPEYGLQEDGRYRLSVAQVEAILELRLHRLTGLEQDKIFNEYKGLLDIIIDLLEILSDRNRLMTVIREELEAIKAEFNDDRRTEITASAHDINIEDLITEEDRVVTISQRGYVKTQPVSDYQAQHRGGRGKSATQVKDEDYITKLAVCSSHDTLLCFSTLGKLYWLKCYELPTGGRAARGRPLNNLLPLEENETVSALLPVREYSDEQYVFMTTSKGTVKKTVLSAFSRPRSNGIRAVDLVENDGLIGVAITDGTADIMLFSNAGKVARFSESNVRAMGRISRGVRGMRLPTDAHIISMVVVTDPASEILTATENGYGKRTPIREYRKINRGGQGVLSIKTSERNGLVVNALCVSNINDIMLITNGGTLVRTPVTEISSVGRNTQGVRLIQLSGDEKLTQMELVKEVLVDESQGEAVVETPDLFATAEKAGIELDDEPALDSSDDTNEEGEQRDPDDNLE